MGKFTLRNDFCIVTFVFMPLSEKYIDTIFTSFLALTAIVNYYEAYGDWLEKRVFLVIQPQIFSKLKVEVHLL